MRLIGIFTFLLAFFPAIYTSGQACHTDSKVVSNRIDLVASIKDDSAKKMVDIDKMIPGLVLDLRYGTANNFMHTILYRHPKAYLRLKPANALLEVQKELLKSGLALKIYDAYRPFSVTCYIWRMIPDRRYASNPKNGSNHNRGLAVDATLVNLMTGKELDMGTGFDSFTDSAHHSFTQLPAKVIANRKLLKNVMWKHGFSMVPTEWWHYQWKNNDDYEVIDLDFDELVGIAE